MKVLGILCPGQGNQHPAMFDTLLASKPAEAVLASAANLLGYHPTEYDRTPPHRDIFSNRPAQLLIGALQLATWTALRDFLPAPGVFLGYSMGELIAYGCAESLSVEATLRLMDRRAALMDEAAPAPAGLLAIRGLTRQEIDALCQATGVEVAIINAADHFVLGGPEPALNRCETSPLVHRATTLKRLQISVPSHTSGLGEASRRFAQELQESPLQPPCRPVLAGVSGAVVRTREEAIQALAKQIAHPINWLACTQSAIEMGCQVFLELGPGNALSKMVQEISPGVRVRSVEDFRTLRGVAAWVGKQLA